MIIVYFILFVSALLNQAIAGVDPLNTQRFVKNKPLSCNVSDIDEKSLDIASLINFALCNNQTVKESWLKVLSNQAKLGSSYGAYLPSIYATSSYMNFRNSTNMPSVGNIGGSGSGFGGINFLTGTGQYSSNRVAIEYLLFDFGKRGASVDALRYGLSMVDYAHSSVLQRTIFDLIQKYYMYMLSTKLLMVRNEAYNLAKIDLDYAKERRRVGLSSKLDELQSNANLSAAKLNMVNAEQQREMARVDLFLYAGLDPASDIVVKDENAGKDISTDYDLFDKNIVDLLEFAKMQNPDLKAAEANVKMSEANLKKTHYSNYPQISTFGNYNRDYRISGLAFNREFESVGVQVSVPLFSGFSSHYNTQSAEREYEASIANLKNKERNIVLEVWSAYNAFKLARENILLTQDLFDAASEAERHAREGYKAGVSDIRDVLLAQSSLSFAKEKNAEAEYGLYISRMNLLRVIGQLKY